MDGLKESQHQLGEFLGQKMADTQAELRLVQRHELLTSVAWTNSRQDTGRRLSKGRIPSESEPEVVPATQSALGWTPAVQADVSSQWLSALPPAAPVEYSLAFPAAAVGATVQSPLQSLRVT